MSDAILTGSIAGSAKAGVPTREELLARAERLVPVLRERSESLESGRSENRTARQMYGVRLEPIDC